MSIFQYQEQPGYFRRLKEALKITQKDLGEKIDRLVGTAESPLTPQQLEDLEEILIGADLGVETTLQIVGRIRETTRGDRFLTSSRLKEMVRRQILEIFQATDGWQEESFPQDPPKVVLVVGVNGVGKTTTIGKLAERYRRQGRTVLLSASDTFRAAAIEQLGIWAERTGSGIVRQQAGSDPAAVLFDAIAAARARGFEVLLADTAGRLHTRSNLMQELEKMKRVAAREVEGAPHEVYLVLDANTGQNGVAQAREFVRTAGVTGLVVAKLDGTAKGGIVVAIARELGIPVRYIGVGEKKEDLLPFDPQAYTDSLLGQN